MLIILPEDRSPRILLVFACHKDRSGLPSPHQFLVDCFNSRKFGEQGCGWPDFFKDITTEQLLKFAESQQIEQMTSPRQLLGHL